MKKFLCKRYPAGDLIHHIDAEDAHEAAKKWGEWSYNHGDGIWKRSAKVSVAPVDDLTKESIWTLSVYNVSHVEAGLSGPVKKRSSHMRRT